MMERQNARVRFPAALTLKPAPAGRSEKVHTLITYTLAGSKKTMIQLPVPQLSVTAAAGAIKVVDIPAAMLIIWVKPEPVPQAAVTLNSDAFAVKPAAVLGLIRVAEQEVVPAPKCTKPEVAALVPTPPQDVFLIQVVEE